MKENIWGSTALVTGAAMGMGRLLSIKLAKMGAKLVLVDINPEKLEETKKAVLNAGSPEALTFTCDISRRTKVYEMAKQVNDKIGPVYLLINNAGIVHSHSFMEYPDKDLQKVMEVNTLAHFWTVKAFLPQMIETGKGQIVTIASAAGLMGVPKMAPYCASKWAAIGFSETIRNELKNDGHKNIKVTIVCPSYIDTGMFDGVKTPFLTPILSPEEMVDKIFAAIEEQKEFVMEPLMVKFVPLLKAVLPSKLFDHVATILGVTTGMRSWRGHRL